MTIKISTAKIKKEWTDYKGHMNVAYYILIFDQNAAETLMTKLDMGEKSALETFCISCLAFGPETTRTPILFVKFSNCTVLSFGIHL